MYLVQIQVTPQTTAQLVTGPSSPFVYYSIMYKTVPALVSDAVVLANLSLLSFNRDIKKSLFFFFFG